jgi:hypothetical protein
VRGAPQPRFAAAMRLPARPDPRERDPEEAVRMSQAQPRVAAFEVRFSSTRPPRVRRAEPRAPKKLKRMAAIT